MRLIELIGLYPANEQVVDILTEDDVRKIVDLDCPMSNLELNQERWEEVIKNVSRKMRNTMTSHNTLRRIVKEELTITQKIWLEEEDELLESIEQYG